MGEQVSGVNVSTVSSYSERGAQAYEDPMNKNFLYGAITVRFLEQIDHYAKGATVLDIGCGTGFVFDVLYRRFEELELHGIGIEPADGMLEIAIDKYGSDPMFEFHSGSFENIPLAGNSVDNIVSTLALHWVKSLDVAVAEMGRVLKDGGSLDILMIARDDGAKFKKAIVAAQRKHLTFAQIMKTATLVQRASVKDLLKTLAPFDDRYDVRVEMFNDVVYGSFDDHMKWWTARSSPVIADVEDKTLFMDDLRQELEKTRDEHGIPFDTAYYWITLRGK